MPASPAKAVESTPAPLEAVPVKVVEATPLLTDVGKAHSNLADAAEASATPVDQAPETAPQDSQVDVPASPALSAHDRPTTPPAGPPPKLAELTAEEKALPDAAPHSQMGQDPLAGSADPWAQHAEEERLAAPPVSTPAPDVAGLLVAADTAAADEDTDPTGALESEVVLPGAIAGDPTANKEPGEDDQRSISSQATQNCRIAINEEEALNTYSPPAGDGDGTLIDVVTDQITPSGMEVLQKPDHEFSTKLSNSMDSDASTCTPAANAAGQVLLTCCQCQVESVELFIDPSDMNRYCERCWIDYYGQPPARCELQPLVNVEVMEIWNEDRLALAWSELPLPGWPPPQVAPLPSSSDLEGEVWSSVAVRVRRDIVGPHARDQNNADRPYPGEILAGRYQCKTLVGEGHFTKAFLAEDLTAGTCVCVKRHRSLSVEALADLMVLGRRLNEVDAGGLHFPRLLDAFYDIVGFTVESLLEGQNCLAVAMNDPKFFCDLRNLRQVANGALRGLMLLDQAGIVHNDVKPDNLIWMDSACRWDGGDTDGSTASSPTVRIVDFGCARLDQREEHGRNWSLAEGGAGHLGKWSPEMTLRLPITHRGDVWGLAISLCELHCGRCVWRNEADTAEVVLAQSIGLCNLYETGVPSSLMRRSPLDIRQLYTPAPRHFPLRRNTLGQLEALQPARYGLEQVLGDDWREAGKAELHELLRGALIIDPLYRPSAAQCLDRFSFASSVSPEELRDVAALDALAAEATPPPSRSPDLALEQTLPLQPSEGSSPSLPPEDQQPDSSESVVGVLA